MIDGFTFGAITVDGRRYTSDIKIIRGSVVPDWWRGSGHTVGIADIHDILHHKPDVVVIGKGDPGYMQVDDSLRQYVEKNGIELIEEETPTAIHTFNRLFQEGKNIAAGFHVGC
jgi:hypothetical protein